MKIKKIIICLAMAVLMSLGTACGNQQPTYNLFGGSYWLENPDTDIGFVNETCIYDVNFNSEKNDDGSPRLKGEVSGTMTTHLTDTIYKNQKCYKFTTLLETTGKYVTDEDYPVSDRVESEVYFLGNKNKLFPLYSKKTVKSTTPMYSVNTGSVLIVKFAYTVTTTYDKEKQTATITTTPDKENTTEGYNVEEDTSTFEKINKKGTFFDNETLIFVPRACDLQSGFSQRFLSIDPLTKATNRMIISVNSSSPTTEFDLVNFVEDDKAPTSVKLRTYNADLMIEGTYSGTPLKLCFASEANARKRLISMKTSLPHSLGTFNYLIKEVKTH